MPLPEGNIMKILFILWTILFVVIFAVRESRAEELPEMIYAADQQELLEMFPLTANVTFADVINAYGHPQMRVGGVMDDREVWSYYKGSTTYTFYFKKGKVHDISKKVSSFIWGGRPLNARELQGINK